MNFMNCDVTLVLINISAQAQKRFGSEAAIIFFILKERYDMGKKKDVRVKGEAELRC